MIRRLGDRLKETHFHDNRGDTDDHRPIGIGTIDWVDVIYALDDIGFEYPVIFEWAGTYWTKLDHVTVAKEFYVNWRQFEKYAEKLAENDKT